jgi:hypothetical protein
VTAEAPNATWTADELQRVGTATELQIASRRADGSLRLFVTVWVVRVGDGLYVRSAHGAEHPWFRRAMASGSGRILAGGVDRDVTCTALSAGTALHADIDGAYHSKYDAFGPQMVGGVVGLVAATATLRLTPQHRPADESG